jgi:hypothetical protein
MTQMKNELPTTTNLWMRGMTLACQLSMLRATGAPERQNGQSDNEAEFRFPPLWRRKFIFLLNFSEAGLSAWLIDSLSIRLFAPGMVHPIPERRVCSSRREPLGKAFGIEQTPTHIPQILTLSQIPSRPESPAKANFLLQ